MRRGSTTIPFSALAITFAATGWLFVVLSCWPGYINADTFQQLKQAVTGSVDDWHAPFTVLLWSGLLRVFPGATGFLLLDTALIWGSCAILARVNRRSGPAVLLIPLLPLLPGLCNYVGQVQVDTILLALFLGGATAAFLSRRRQHRRERLLLGVAATILVWTGVLVRPNAVFAAVPLFFLLLARQNRKPWMTVLLAGCLLSPLPILQRAAATFTAAGRTGIAAAIPTYGLLAMSEAEHHNLFPGQWEPEESRRIAEGCWSPVQWDTTWTGPCHFIFERLHERRLWFGTGLDRAWIAAAASHPGAFLVMQLAEFRRLLFVPNSPNILWPTPNRWNDSVPQLPPAFRAPWKRWAESGLGTTLSRPALALVLGALAVVLALRRRPAPRDPAACALALALAASGLVYLDGFAVYGVSAEYRYAEWPMFAVATALVLAALPQRIGIRPVPAAVTLPCMAIAALSVGLVAGAAVSDLPQIDRTVSVRSVDGRPIRVEQVVGAATPYWIATTLPPVIAAAGWRTGPNGASLVSGSAPLSVWLRSRPEDVRVILATGPDNGTAAVTVGTATVTRSTAAPAPGRTELIVPADLPGSPIGRSLELRVAAATLGTSALVFLAGLALVRRTTTRHRPGTVGAEPDADGPRILSVPGRGDG